ncbi:MAG: DUF3892 domain-containing protein [Acidimicrobiia bacterium]
MYWEPRHTADDADHDQNDGLKHLVDVFAQATEQDKPIHIHAIGSGWAFEDLARSHDWMVCLKNLNRQLDYVVGNGGTALTQVWQDRQANPKSATVLVHFEAGITIGALSERLDSQGLAMPTLGGENGQALAGVISTSTHGGDWQQPPFPDLVRAIHLVTDGGKEWWIERASDRITSDDRLEPVLPCAQIVSDDRVFDAALVACGRFGVLYSFVLEVRRRFRVVEVVTTPARSDVLQALREGVGALQALRDGIGALEARREGIGALPTDIRREEAIRRLEEEIRKLEEEIRSGNRLFQPLFDLLSTTTPPSGLDDATGDPYFLQVLFNSQKPNDVWVHRRWEAKNPDLPDLPAPEPLPPPGSARVTATASEHDLAVQLVETVNAALLTAGATIPAVATLAVGAIPGALPGAAPLLSLTPAIGAILAVYLTGVAAYFNGLVASREFTLGSVLSAALEALWLVPAVSHVIPQVNYMVINGRFETAIVLGRRAKHHIITKDPIPDSIKSASIELVFDATTTDYVDFLELILGVAPLFQQAGYISLRPSRASKAYLSMHGVSGSHAMSIEIASLQGLPGNAEWMAFVHRLAVSRNGRPHWGQYNKLDALDVALLYGKALNEWREGLLKVSGTSTLFSNEFSQSRGLEPVATAREVTAVRKTTGDVITHLCNQEVTWSPVTVAQAIRDIESGSIEYFVRSGDRIVPVRSVDGAYVRSQADDSQENNLDNLPRC